MQNNQPDLQLKKQIRGRRYATDKLLNIPVEK